MDSDYWMKKFARYKPLEIEIFRDYDHSNTAHAIVRFETDWTGFKNAIEFEKSFEHDGHSKNEWNERKETSLGPTIYGWFAREDDYKSEGVIGDYLREKGEFKSISDQVLEAAKDKNEILGSLFDEIELKNDNLDQLQTRYNEKSMSLNRILEEKDLLHQDFYKQTRKLQRISHENIKRVLAEEERMKLNLENMEKGLKAKEKELNEREAVTERDRLKVEEERQKLDLKNKELELATEVQKKSSENVLRLVEEQKREKEEALKRFYELQRDLDEKQKLEMEIEELRGKLEVMKHMGDDDDSAVQQKIDEMNKQLDEKKEGMTDIEDLNSQLLTKERQSNDELQAARKVLIEGLIDLLNSSHVNIGIKKMGEINDKAFKKVCKERYEADEADVKAVELCSFWQDKMTNAEWHPFIVIEDDKGNAQKIIKEDDVELQRLKEEWGVEVYCAVTTAMLEMQEYNASGCYMVLELWNFKENRKATLKEVIHNIFCQVKSASNKKRRRN